MGRLPSSKRVFTEISIFLRGSNSLQRGRSYAASVPSYTPKGKEVRRSISKADRKVMVEAFVDRYKALNSGKFPSISDTQREVGGSFYVIRAIVLELQYESKNPSIKTSETLSSKEIAKENKPVIEVEEVLSKEAESVTVDNTEAVKIQMPAVTCEDSEHLSKHSHLLKERTEEVLHNSRESLEDIVKAKEPLNAQEFHNLLKNPSINTTETPLTKEIAKESKPGIEVEKVSSKEGSPSKEAEAVTIDNTESVEVRTPKVTFEDSEHLSTHSHLRKENPEEVLHNSRKKLEDIVKEKTQTKVVVDIHPPNPKPDKHQRMPESERRDASLKPQEEEIEKKSSMWGNLKSLADGIISMWRKL